MRDHTPIVYKDFNGIWRPIDTNQFYDSDESCPAGHQLDLINFDFDFNNITTRSRFGPFVQFGATPSIVHRIHVITNIPNQFGMMLLVSLGNIYLYDGTSSTLLYSGIFATDYQFLPYLDRIYILPNMDVGYSSSTFDPLLVYQFNITGTIRQACGIPPATSASIANSGVGVVQAGTRFFGVCYETDTGFITPPKATSPASLVTPGNQQVAFTSIPTGGTEVVARWIVGTRAIANPIPGGTLESYQYYAIARIGDNSTTSLNVNFYDSQLLNDLSYLSDIVTQMTGNSFCFYKGRIVVTSPSFTNRHTAYLSNQNDPETFDQVSGIQIIDPTTEVCLSSGLATGLTGCQAYRDVLYYFKFNSTYSTIDNQQEPALWSITSVDQTIGSRPYGICATTNKNSESIDYLIIASPSGLYLFVGYYYRPEISWKNKISVSNALNDSIDTTTVSIVNDYIKKKIYLGNSGSTLRGLFLFDYNDVNPDLTDYYQKVKISEWRFGSLFSPLFVGNLSLYPITGSSNFTLLLGSNAPLTYGIYSLGSSVNNLGNEDFINASMIFPSISDVDDKIIHYAATRIRYNLINSNSFTTQTLNISIINANESTQLVTKSFNDIVANGAVIEPTFLSNFLTQKASLQISINGLPRNSSADLSANISFAKIISYVRPIYSSVPFQYYV